MNVSTVLFYSGVDRGVTENMHQVLVHSDMFGNSFRKAHA